MTNTIKSFLDTTQKKWSNKCDQTAKAQLFQVCNLFDDWNINCNSLINSIKPYNAYKIELLKFLVPNHPVWSLPNPWKFIISLAVKHSAFSPRMTFFLEKMLLPPSPFYALCHWILKELLLHLYWLNGALWSLQSTVTKHDISKWSHSNLFIIMTT